MNTMDEEVRNLELMTDEVDPEEIAKDMALKISKMYEDMEKKVTNAKDSLLGQLSVTADKYRTANGVMSALSTVRTVFGEHSASINLQNDIKVAKTMATNMSVITQKLMEKAAELDPEDFRTLCDGVYNADFVQSEDNSGIDMVQELMILQLCQNIGPNAEDIAEFIDHAKLEIEKARTELSAYCESNGINFIELCGEES